MIIVIKKYFYYYFSKGLRHKYVQIVNIIPLKFGLQVFTCKKKNNQSLYKLYHFQHIALFQDSILFISHKATTETVVQRIDH